MHELGISRNIVAIVAEAAAGRRIRRVTVEIGKLSGVVPQALQFSFGLVADGTPAAGAVLDIREIQARARCADCAAEFQVDSFFAACGCGCRQLERLAGEELNVKSLELED
jgi:hydrogenase nickel incorporation protein HypA/HybF